MAHGQLVKWISTLPFVYVPQVYKAIPMWPVLKQAAAVTLIVPPLKNVTLYLEVVLPEGNVLHFVTQETVLKVLIVLPEIIVNHAPVGTH